MFLPLLLLCTQMFPPSVGLTDCKQMGSGLWLNTAGLYGKGHLSESNVEVSWVLTGALASALPPGHTPVP